MRTNQRLALLWLDALTTELGASAGTHRHLHRRSDLLRLSGSRKATWA